MRYQVFIRVFPKANTVVVNQRHVIYDNQIRLKHLMWFCGERTGKTEVDNYNVA